MVCNGVGFVQKGKDFAGKGCYKVIEVKLLKRLVSIGYSKVLSKLG